MAADRRILDDEAISSMVKVAKNPFIIAAASGNGSCTLAVKRAVQKGARKPEDLVGLVDADSYALCLTADGLVWRLQDGAVWPCPAGTTQTIGSGCDLATGFLDALGDHSQEAVKRCFAYVATKRADCGGGVDFRTFGR